MKRFKKSWRHLTKQARHEQVTGAFCAKAANHLLQGSPFAKTRKSCDTRVFEWPTLVCRRVVTSRLWYMHRACLCVASKVLRYLQVWVGGHCVIGWEVALFYRLTLCEPSRSRSPRCSGVSDSKKGWRRASAMLMRWAGSYSSMRSIRSNSDRWSGLSTAT